MPFFRHQRVLLPVLWSRLWMVRPLRVPFRLSVCRSSRFPGCRRWWGGCRAVARTASPPAWPWKKPSRNPRSSDQEFRPGHYRNFALSLFFYITYFYHINFKFHQVKMDRKASVTIPGQGKTSWRCCRSGPNTCRRLFGQRSRIWNIRIKLSSTIYIKQRCNSSKVIK